MRCLSASRSVCYCLGSLSLASSLAQGSAGGDAVPFKTVGADRATAPFTIPATYVGGETGASPNPALPVRPGEHYAFATYPAGICHVPFTVTP